MSGRKTTLLYTFAEDQDSSSNFDTKSNPTNVIFLDNAFVQVICDNTVNGTLNILVSSDKVDPKMGQTVTNWQPLDFGTATVFNGVDGGSLNMHQMPFNFIAVEWVDAGGSGNITVKLSSKMVGG